MSEKERILELLSLEKSKLIVDENDFSACLNILKLNAEYKKLKETT